MQKLPTPLMTLGTLLVLNMTAVSVGRIIINFSTAINPAYDYQYQVNDENDSMSIQEIEAFNNQFESYRGKQTGSQISSLTGRLIGNCSTYRDEYAKVPSVKFEQLKENDESGELKEDLIVNIEYNELNEDLAQEYIDGLSKIKNNLINKHTYNVEFYYDATTGLLNEVIITY